jgi:hypothetical protein
MHTSHKQTRQLPPVGRLWQTPQMATKGWRAAWEKAATEMRRAAETARAAEVLLVEDHDEKMEGLRAASEVALVTALLKVQVAWAHVLELDRARGYAGRACLRGAAVTGQPVSQAWSRAWSRACWACSRSSR